MNSPSNNPVELVSTLDSFLDHEVSLVQELRDAFQRAVPAVRKMLHDAGCNSPGTGIGG